MRWRRRRGRSMIEDRRGRPAGGLFRGGSGLGRGSFPVPLPRGGTGGLGLLVILVVVIGAAFLLRSDGTETPEGPGPGGPGLSGAPDPDADLVDFLGFVVEDVQTFWQGSFREDGRTYQATKLVLFEGTTRTGCGLGSEETGPFYCPADRKVYLDLDFFRALASRLEAPGDFAQAYVVAHEFGHHVQTLLGTERRVRESQRRSPSQANDLSVRMELQADCFAGVWANSAYEQQLLETGDLEEALTAAAAVGDDRIQRSAGQRVNRETWTHGSSAQRRQWFTEGFESGDPRACDTFSASI